MDNREVRSLLKKYRMGTLDKKERATLESWYLVQAKRDATIGDKELHRNLNRIRQAITNGNGRSRSLFSTLRWCAAAAAAIIAVTAWLMHEVSTEVPDSRIGVQNDILPGGQKAVLKLADGSMINLNGAQGGIMISDDGVRYADGKPVLTGAAPTEALQLTTPKGGIYQVTLSDGTRVWLNAASTLNYPARFDEGRRVVTLDGEAFFEVTKGQTPFIVRTTAQDVTVLGTVFNVSAYGDEPVGRTTLIEGKVKVRGHTSGQEVMLTVGEEAAVSPDRIEKREVDADLAVAWKSGNFRFEETGVKEVMKQLGRWYDVEVEYRGAIPEKYVYGIIKRDRTLSAVLALLEEGGIKVEIDQTGDRPKMVVLPD